MPTARLAPDGEIAITASAMNGTQRFNAGFEVLPWLEGSFRYSHLSNYGAQKNRFDRSFGLKVRFWREDDWLPEVSMGIRDLLGTGVYGSEYFVASKHFWNDLDLTAGLGFGRLADNNTFANPFGELISSFRKRASGPANGGQVNFGQFFHGPSMGLFGGAVWRTPIDRLSLLIEYSSDHYKKESGSGQFQYRMPVNVGLSYQPLRNLLISAGWMYGSSYGASLTLTVDPAHDLAPQRIGVPPPPPIIRTDLQQRHAIAELTSTPQSQFSPNTDEKKLTLSQALLSEGPGIRDFAVTGDTLNVMVAMPVYAALPCSTYALIAAGVGSTVRSVSVTDTENGRMANCDVGDPVYPAQITSQPASAVIDATGQAHPSIDAIKQKITADAAAQAIKIDAIGISGSQISVYYRNHHYFAEANAAGRLARVLMADAPPDVEVFHLVETEHGVPLREFQILRSAFERALQFDAGPGELREAASVQMPALNTPVLDSADGDNYPRLSWSLSPQTRQSVFDPAAPVQVQLMAAGTASVDITRGLTVTGTGDLNIWNNFQTNGVNTSLLPHVRSDIGQYFKHGSSGIEDLMAEYRTRLAPDVFAKVKVGYLEDMFAGAGAEVLWRPDDQPFALGADIYEVWQRNFDRLFGLQHYNVLTGHVSLYYQLPWYGLHANIHAGRYLAGDYGATFELTRRFDTGVEIGAYATFTNVPFAKFGEGSFDKGIVVRIPLEWVFPIRSDTVYDLTLHSLSRDGGQRLRNDDSLYEETLRTGYNEIYDHFDELTNP